MDLNKVSDKQLLKMAEEDAQRWANAEAFYGEGAGNRRKLITMEVEDKSWRIPGYLEAFNRAYEAVDKTKAVKEAVKEREALDRAAKFGKNLRALKRGDIRGLSTGVYVVVGVAIVAHKTGYDKKVEAKAKELWAKAKAKHEKNKRENVYNITSIVQDGPAKTDG